MRQEITEEILLNNDFIDTTKMRQEITEEILLNNEFVETTDNVIKEEYSTYFEIFNYKSFDRFIDDTTPMYITISKGESNINEENFTVRIDNNRHETIGYADLRYIDQFNKLMEVYDNKFTLKNN